MSIVNVKYQCRVYIILVKTLTNEVCTLDMNTIDVKVLLFFLMAYYNSVVASKSIMSYKTYYTSQ